MRWVFEQVSEGLLHVEQIMKVAKLRGLRVTKSTLWRSLRNPVYCGRIYLKEYKDEPACDVKGNHEPIISETLFYDVQDYLDGKKNKKKKRTTVFSSNDFILRGYLVCPKCGKVLTASASKGRSKKYFYYHCHYTCGVRFKSPGVNESFTDYLMKYNAKDGMAQVYYKALKNVYQRDWAKKAEARGKFTERLDDPHEKVKKARFKFMNDEISKSEYMEFKAECEKEINDLETRVIASTSQENQIDDLLQQSVDNLINLRILYLTGNIGKQRKIIGSIFPEKVIFDGSDFRTIQESEPLRLIFNVDKGLEKIKMAQNSLNPDLCRVVAGTGLPASLRSAVFPFVWPYPKPSYRLRRHWVFSFALFAE